jgi:predicted TIM-barrel fold metal-dependent hydrolase
MEEFQRLPIQPESRENMLWHNGARILGLED